ncbi:MAG: RNP-1 like protein RNA-binding protein [Parcubacteria group bacterium GW2011_GWA2_44_13]|nr:MAG: RNP-1 like protein RNA-binding protein [Parcubacteria group bacterium GW2011_GWA2_44_13]
MAKKLYVGSLSYSTTDSSIDSFNGKELDGRKITVNEARPMGERPPRREGGGGYGGGYGGGGRRF